MFPFGKNVFDENKFSSSCIDCRERYEEPTSDFIYTKYRLKDIPLPFFDHNLVDTFVFFIYCPFHEKIALACNGNNERWLPFVEQDPRFKTEDKLLEASLLLILGDNKKNVFEPEVPFFAPKLLEVRKVQIPFNETLVITRRTFEVRLKVQLLKNWKCCQNRRRLHWESFEKLVNFEAGSLTGPEPNYFHDKIVGEQKKRKQVEDKGEEVDEDEEEKKPKVTEVTVVEALDIHDNGLNIAITLSKFIDKDNKRAYKLFLQHSAPSSLLSPMSFADALNRLGWDLNANSRRRLFHAFNYKRTFYLSFQEFLVGLIGTHPETEHSNHLWHEIRLGLIFRYYDGNQDGFLDYKDMRVMTKEIRKAWGGPVDDDNVDRETFQRWKALFLRPPEKCAPMMFAKHVLIPEGTAHRFSGCELLLRNPVNPLVKQQQFFPEDPEEETDDESPSEETEHEATEYEAS